MKHLIFVMLIAFVTIVTSCQTPTKTDEAQTAGDSLKVGVDTVSVDSVKH